MFDKAKGSESQLLEAKVMARYFELTRTTQLREVWGRVVEKLAKEKKLKLKGLDFDQFSSIVAFHKELRITYLNYQIISQIYYDAIIKTTYLFYMLSKIDPNHEILTNAPNKELLNELLDFYPSNPLIVHRGWLSRKIPLVGALTRKTLFQVLLHHRGETQGVFLHVHVPPPDRPPMPGVAGVQC